MHNGSIPHHDETYARTIASALHRELGSTRGATKRVMRWTGAGERTVKNWFAGSKGPSAPHLLLLAKHSDAVMADILLMAGRDQPSFRREITATLVRLQTVLGALEKLLL